MQIESTCDSYRREVFSGAVWFEAYACQTLGLRNFGNFDKILRSFGLLPMCYQTSVRFFFSVDLQFILVPYPNLAYIGRVCMANEPNSPCLAVVHTWDGDGIDQEDVQGSFNIQPCALSSTMDFKFSSLHPQLPNADKDNRL